MSYSQGRQFQKWGEAQADRDARIVKAARENPDMSRRQIGERFGVTSSVVTKALEAAGIPRCERRGASGSVAATGGAP